MRPVQDVLDLVLWRCRTQALGLDRPEHAPLVVAAQRAEHRRVQHAPGRAEVADRGAGRVGEKTLAADDLVLGTARPAEPEASVRPAVAADLVARRGDSPYRFGRPCRALADQEERGAHALSVEHG